MPNYSNIKKRLLFQKLKRKILSHVKIVRGLILSVIVIIALFLGIFIFRIVSNSFIGQAVALGRDFIFPSSSRIITNNGNINVLILGIGGAGHDAPDLSDTIILSSISTKTNKISLISVPRDIWIPDLKDKVNSAYMYGKEKAGIKGGLVLAKSTVSEILGTQIDYAIVLDFSAFKDTVDALGGITVDVKNSFTDSQYPIAGKENDNCNGDPNFACRYTTVTFNKGLQLMDGERALEFVRSRHAEGIEGNDIAREARQQLVVNAIIKKALTPQIFTNITTDRKLIQIAKDSIITDLKPSEEATLASFVIKARSNLKSYTIPDNLLFNPPNQYLYHNDIYSHAFVFIPARNDKKWDDVQAWVQSVLP